MATPQPVTIVLAAATGLGYGRGVLRGAVRYAKLRRGCNIMPVPLETIPELKTWPPDFGYVVQAGRIDLAQDLAGRQTAVVNIADNDESLLLLPTIISDHREIGRLAAEHFLSRGDQRIAFFGPPDWYSRLRLEGLRHRLDTDPQTAEAPWAANEQELRSWLRGQRMPVAIMAAHDAAAQQALDIVQRMDLRIPEQVAILGVDNDELICEASRIPLSSVAIDAVRIGFEAARAVDEMLAGRQPDIPQPMLIPPLGVVTRRSSEVTAVEDELVARAVTWMQVHLQEPLTIEELLENLPVSRRKLEKRFQTSLGRSPGQELRRLRVERLKLLMDTTDLPLARLASEVGLASASVLCQIFSRETGMSPSRYRQRGRLPQ